MSETFTRISEASWQAFRADARPGPVQMLNLIRLRERADYPDGRVASGREAYTEYSRLSSEPAAARGMRIVWRGAFERTMVGPEHEHWDVAFVAEYPDIAAFVSLMRDPTYREAMLHRAASVADSRLISLAPAEFGTTFIG